MDFYSYQQTRYLFIKSTYTATKLFENEIDYIGVGKYPWDLGTVGLFYHNIKLIKCITADMWWRQKIIKPSLQSRVWKHLEF